jgi:hypothetical protein
MLFRAALPYAFATLMSVHGLIASAQPATHSNAARPAAACDTMPRLALGDYDKAPDITGQWDFAIDMGTAVSTGSMALGWIDGAYAGALTPDATNTLAIRRLTLVRDSVQMAVASREGDVMFFGRLLGTGGVMCGVVHYHEGKRFSMIATLRRRARAS